MTPEWITIIAVLFAGLVGTFAAGAPVWVWLHRQQHLGSSGLIFAGLGAALLLAVLFRTISPPPHYSTLGERLSNATRQMSETAQTLRVAERNQADTTMRLSKQVEDLSKWMQSTDRTLTDLNGRVTGLANAKSAEQVSTSGARVQDEAPRR